MPISLESTRALRGEKPKRRWTLIVRGHGRWGYLRQSVESIDATIGLDRFARKILSVDGPGPDEWPDGWDVLSTGAERQGLTANVTQAWRALDDDDEMVFDTEDDFLIQDAPLDEMADVLDDHPHVANMTLVRQPVNPWEERAGGLLWSEHFQGDFADHGGWLEQRRLWSINPSVLHADTLRAVTPGVEKLLTAQAIANGWSFGFWGKPTDPPRAIHIGTVGGMGSPGWKA